MLISEPGKSRIQDQRDFTGALTSGFYLQWNGTAFTLQAVSGGSGSVGIGAAVTGATSGSIFYASGATLAQDNGNLFWDGTNHRLGLGATTPAGKLDVKAGALSEVPITARGTASQSADYVRCLDNIGQAEARILPGGHAWFQGQARIGELTGNGPNYVGLQSPADLLSGNVILTLPGSYPSADGMVPTFSTAGVWTWGTGGGGGGASLLRAPTTTADNTAQPTGSGIVGLTVDIPSGSSSDAVVLKRAGVTAGRFFQPDLSAIGQPSVGYGLRLDGYAGGFARFFPPQVGGIQSVFEASLDGTHIVGSMSREGGFYGQWFGSQNTTTGTIYNHLTMNPNDHQTWNYDTYQGEGTRMVLASTGSAHFVTFAAQSTGILTAQADNAEFMQAGKSGSAATIAFLGATAITRPTVTGSRGGNAALTSLLTALASLGLVTNSSSA